ncbi:MAG: TolC family protein [Desulfobacterales bacterium]|nr:TolC family protein [Desulfobacterales bacterium]
MATTYEAFLGCIFSIAALLISPPAVAAQGDRFTADRTVERPSFPIFEKIVNNTSAGDTDSGQEYAGFGKAQPGTTAAMGQMAMRGSMGTNRDGRSHEGVESNRIRLTLLDAIRYSFEGNREIKVVSYEPQKAHAQIEGAESVFDASLFADSKYRRDPNLVSSINDVVSEDDSRTQAGIRKPLTTGGTFSTYLESRYGELKNADFDRTFKHVVSPTIELQQPLLKNIGSKQEKTAIKIANFQANISDAEFRQKVNNVTNKVAVVYWKLYLFKELVAINRKNFDMAEEVHRREAERYDRGISQQLDVARARSNAQARRSTWLRSLEEYQLAMDRLKLLLNWRVLKIDSDAQIIPVETPKTTPIVVDEIEAVGKAIKNRPEVIKAQQELMIRTADQELAAHQRLPKLDAYGRYGISGYGAEYDEAWSDIAFNEDNTWEVGIQFEWPIGNRLARSRFNKTSLSRKQANAQLKRIKDGIMLDVKQVLHRLATVKGEIEANRLAKEAAEKVVEGEFARFDIGQTTNEELLRAQDLLAVTSRSYARAIADYNTAIQDLATAQGVLPDGIVMEDVEP